MIRRSIFRIFILFSIIGMTINMFLLMFGLCFWQLFIIIDHGARPPIMLNIAIMAEAGATISRDGLAQQHNDLIIAKGFYERIIKDYFVDKDASRTL